MKDIVGLLIVIAAPFFYLYAIIKASRFVLSKIKDTKKKALVLVFCIAFSVLLPFIDEIIGRIYFVYLCRSQGGAVIYKKIELGKEYFQKDGTPKFITEKGELNVEMLNNKYIVNRDFDSSYVPSLNIARRQYEVIETGTMEKIGRHTSFVYFRGWLINFPGPGLSSKSCSGNIGFYQNFIKQIFIKKETDKNQTTS